jgi:hypothetical protein
MDPSQYDEISPPLIEKLKTQPSFMIHVAFVDNGRFTVSEIWESHEQHDRWFNENVKPMLAGRSNGAPRCRARRLDWPPSETTPGHTASCPRSRRQ